ncbi:hypothetical protein MJ904_23090 [Massilia sp. MB5]|uniref:hypothetical protein n=1 Tax=Massilia sp. MB5 TaxID=2919578 RepID=UPI001F0FEFA7|nr:hypothetical protein [Massilia sp. MB5]UMR29883.1 hypothetical protein MJ904_23090 [Massilia sp. MB5]
MSMTSIGAAPAAAPTLPDAAPAAPEAAGLLSAAVGGAPLSLFGQLLSLVDAGSAPDGASPAQDPDHGADEAVAPSDSTAAATPAFSTMPLPVMLAALAPATVAAASAGSGPQGGVTAVGAIAADGAAPTHPALLTAQAEQPVRPPAAAGDAAARGALPLPPQLASQLHSGSDSSAPAAGGERQPAMALPTGTQSGSGARADAAPCWPS